MMEVQACRKAHPDVYVKVNAFDSTRGVESLALSFIVQRPAEEPGFRLVRQETNDRVMNYTLERRAAGGQGPVA
jgi:ribulose-bisphosphate carboxylase small chain